jgi:hypothetical protein
MLTLAAARSPADRNRSGTGTGAGRSGICCAPVSGGGSRKIPNVGTLMRRCTKHQIEKCLPPPMDISCGVRWRGAG